jgi:hypothetical protein
MRKVDELGGQARRGRSCEAVAAARSWSDLGCFADRCTHTVLSRFALVARLRQIAVRYSVRGGDQTIKL